MLAIEEAGGYSPSLAETGEGHHLPGLGALEGTSLLQGLTACKRNKHKHIILKKKDFSADTAILQMQQIASLLLLLNKSCTGLLLT